MGARHRQRKADQAAFATEARELRKAQHRAQRHAVHQTLHESAVDELDDVVLPEPKATRSRIEPAERDIAPNSGTTFKPWKQPFWKRRRNDRRAKELAYRRLATEDGF
ncbi:MAG: hypothetical protein ACLFRV_03190 [Acidimicrobiales bacterium]